MEQSVAQQNPEIAHFLQNNRVAVLSTADGHGGNPHGAVVYYSTTSRFHLFFVTKTDTTKHKNLQSNPQAHLVIYDAASQKTAQISGTAQVVDDPKRLQTALELMAQYAKESSGSDRLPISRLDAGDYVLYQITPRVIRFGEFKYSPGPDMFRSVMPDDDSLGRV